MVRSSTFRMNTSPRTFVEPTVRFPTTVLIASSSAPMSSADAIVSTFATTLFVEPLRS